MRLTEFIRSQEATKSLSKKMSDKKEFKPFSQKRGGRALADPEPNIPSVDPNAFKSKTPIIDKRKAPNPQNRQPFVDKKDGLPRWYPSQNSKEL